MVALDNLESVSGLDCESVNGYRGLNVSEDTDLLSCLL